MSLESKISILKDRAEMLSQARLFFSKKHILEVDTPLLSSTAPIDAHIDIMTTKMHDGRLGYFHSSPEYAMKRLISAGLENIYQISHVYRFGEEGHLHNPEFCMVEWYESPCSFDKIIDNTVDFIKIFLSGLPVKIASYEETLQKYTGLSLKNATENSLAEYIKEHSPEAPNDIFFWDIDTLLQYIVSFLIEPFLGNDELFVIKYFPASQAALSQVTEHDNLKVAERFEIYYKGIELANGYHELSDSAEQRTRFSISNKKRVELNKEPLPLDELLLKALEKGLPDCCGVAVGFDRLMMLRHKKKTIAEVIPMAW
ncbi:MAG: EF-P lysine aminoacylase GenX, partial [Chlamydiae bacterium]|nr:EF-P lysine aminoacylase GenX [Chlamydiota bacterium]